MKYQNKLKKERGFSLVEMLVVIAVIGIIAAIAVPTIGSITGKSNEGKTKRNAQNIASLYNASRGVGAVYPVKTTSGIIDKLVAGVTGPALAGSDFQMPGMADAEKTAAMKYVSYDEETDMMVYDPSGGQVAEASGGWWGDWQPDPSVGVDVVTATSLRVPAAVWDNQLEEIQMVFPHLQFEAVQAGSGLDHHISYYPHGFDLD